MEPQNINKQISDKIDNLKYTDFDEPKGEVNKVSDKITIGWDKIITEPFSNTSKETLKELKYLGRLTNNLTQSEKSLIDLVDKEPLDLFKPILKKHNLELDLPKFNKIWAMTEPVIMNLKAKYNRPRPYQLAPFFGIDIKIQESETHHTGAYPSGHTAYAAMAALMLSDLYPDFSNQFFQKIGMAGYARNLQGVHYPSDNRAAMVITGAIWENIRTQFPPVNTTES